MLTTASAVVLSQAGSRSDLRMSMGTPAGLGQWWSGVPSAGRRCMQRSGRALRPQGTGAPWGVLLRPWCCWHSAPRGPEEPAPPCWPAYPSSAASSSRGLSFPVGSQDLCPLNAAQPPGSASCWTPCRLMSCLRPSREAVMSTPRGLGGQGWADLTARRRRRHLEGHAAPTVCTFLRGTRMLSFAPIFKAPFSQTVCQVPPGCSLKNQPEAAHGHRILTGRSGSITPAKRCKKRSPMTRVQPQGPVGPEAADKTFEPLLSTREGAKAGVTDGKHQAGGVCVQGTPETRSSVQSSPGNHSPHAARAAGRGSPSRDWMVLLHCWSRVARVGGRERSGRWQAAGRRGPAGSPQR